MRHKIAKIMGVSAIVLVGAMALGGCSDKAMERYQDAERSDSVNRSPASVGTMPDGFSNFAFKCDGPNMVYVIYHGDSAYGSIDVVPNDPRCA